MANKKLATGNIDSLLGQISEKRQTGELPKTERQHVQPFVADNAANRENVDTVKRDAVNTAKGPGGRPSAKAEGITYVKISPRIPDSLKEEVQVALVTKRFKDATGKPITTLDEIVAIALQRFIK